MKRKDCPNCPLNVWRRTSISSQENPARLRCTGYWYCDGSSLWSTTQQSLKFGYILVISSVLFWLSLGSIVVWHGISILDACLSPPRLAGLSMVHFRLCLAKLGREMRLLHSSQYTFKCKGLSIFLLLLSRSCCCRYNDQIDKTQPFIYNIRYECVCGSVYGCQH